MVSVTAQQPERVLAKDSSQRLAKRAKWISEVASHDPVAKAFFDACESRREWAAVSLVRDLDMKHLPPAIEEACQLGLPRVCSELMKTRGVYVDHVCDEAGSTLLHLACAAPSNRCEAIDVLLRFGAKLSTKPGVSIISPLGVAVRLGHEDVVRKLLDLANEEGADPSRPLSFRNLFGRGPSLGESSEAHKMLAQRSKDGKTLLHLAAGAQGDEILKLLLSCKVIDVEATDEAGETALFVAVSRLSLSNVALLLEHGAKHNIANKKGLTPLMVAAKGWDRKMWLQLLEAGADPNVRDSEGQKMLDAAKNTWSTPLFLDLLKFGGTSAIGHYLLLEGLAPLIDDEKPRLLSLADASGGRHLQAEGLRPSEVAVWRLVEPCKAIYASLSLKAYKEAFQSLHRTFKPPVVAARVATGAATGAAGHSSGNVGTADESSERSSDDENGSEGSNSEEDEDQEGEGEIEEEGDASEDDDDEEGENDGMDHLIDGDDFDSDADSDDSDDSSVGAREESIEEPSSKVFDLIAGVNKMTKALLVVLQEIDARSDYGDEGDKNVFTIAVARDAIRYLFEVLCVKELPAATTPRSTDTWSKGGLKAAFREAFETLTDYLTPDRMAAVILTTDGWASKLGDFAGRAAGPAAATTMVVMERCLDRLLKDDQRKIYDAAIATLSKDPSFAYSLGSTLGKSSKEQLPFIVSLATSFNHSSSTVATIRVQTRLSEFLEQCSGLKDRATLLEALRLLQTPPILSSLRATGGGLSLTPSKRRT
jgi:ankyrin repeat protein